MKTIILAGGFGTRLSEETEVRPKPLVEIGGRPILWHIMKTFSHQGFNDFGVALGYKGEQIKDYFLRLLQLSDDLTVDIGTGRTELHATTEREPWKVHLANTGLHTMTGGRLERLKGYVGQDTFMMTYGDGVADVNLAELVAFHKRHGRIATVTAVRPPARFGVLEFDGDFVQSFSEKSQIDAGWINGGFFVLNAGVFDYLDGPETIFERAPLERLAADGQLAAYRHHGFWQCMDTVRDLRTLNDLWQSGRAPWKVW